MRSIQLLALHLNSGSWNREPQIMLTLSAQLQCAGNKRNAFCVLASSAWNFNGSYSDISTALFCCHFDSANGPYENECNYFIKGSFNYSEQSKWFLAAFLIHYFGSIVAPNKAYTCMTWFRLCSFSFASSHFRFVFFLSRSRSLYLSHSLALYLIFRAVSVTLWKRFML